MKDWFTDSNPFACGDAETNHHTDVDGKGGDNRGCQGGEAEFGSPSSTSVLYKNLLNELHAMDDRNYLPSYVIILDTLSNFFTGPVLANASALLLMVKRRAYWTDAVSMLKRG